MSQTKHSEPCQYDPHDKARDPFEKFPEVCVCEVVRTEDTAVSKAVATIGEALRNDPAYLISWQANIAMAFIDEWFNTKHGGAPSHMQVNHMANRAAEAFLRNLSRKS